MYKQQYTERRPSMHGGHGRRNSLQTGGYIHDLLAVPQCCLLVHIQLTYQDLKVQNLVRKQFKAHSAISSIPSLVLS